MNRSGGGGGGVVEQIMSGGNPNCWNSSISPPDFMPYSSTTSSSSSYTNFLLNPPPPYAPHPPPPAPSLHPLFTSNWHGGHEHEHHNNNTNPELPDSWTHLIMSGAVGEEENGRGGIWQQHASDVDDVKQESSEKSSYVYGDDGSAGKPNWSHHQMLLLPPTNNAISSSPPKSSSSLTLATSILDFSNSHTQATPPPPPPPPSAECNSNTGGGAPKKARVQQSSSSSTFKVRKEKLGDRIAALHQLVSPFGKTDTASVLLEAIGYIRFLQSQIEALSLPYLANNNGSPITIKHHHPVQGEKNCLFPEDPGQLLNENCLKKRKAATQQEGCQHEEEGKKDLRSRGLCLVPVSCTLQVGSDNGADYWAPGFGTGGFR